MSRRSLVTRIALASACAAAFAVGGIAVVFRGYVERILLDRVDRQLVERADGAPILAAIGQRLSESELNAVAEGARVRFVEGAEAGESVVIGAMPTQLPTDVSVGFDTVRADGENWRLYTIEVIDVPRVGDRALVQLGAPLGDVDRQAISQRRRLLLVGAISIAVAGLLGAALGQWAARPMRRLRRDAARVGEGPSADWRVAERYGVVEVDEVAAVLNAGLERVSLETERREAALEAARAFTASAAHELRTPLASAMTNLDVAVRDSADSAGALGAARAQLGRMASTLSALRDLADAELAGDSWFERLDLADLVAVIVEDESRRHPDVRIDLDAPAELWVRGWRDGLRVACGNIVRNALVHGSPSRPALIEVAVRADLDGSAAIEVRDHGPGIAAADHERLLRRFERGASSAPGSGLGLALVAEVAAVHGGSVEIEEGEGGGARVTLHLGVL